jgi:hypothetical protein
MGALLWNAALSDGYVNVNDGCAAAAFRWMKQCDCPAGRPGRVSARQPTRFFASPKKWGKKGDPGDAALRFAPGAHAAGTEIGKRPKLAALRQRTLLYPISAPATWRHQRGPQLQKQKQRQRQRSLRGTSKATATVAARARANVTAALACNRVLQASPDCQHVN